MSSESHLQTCGLVPSSEQSAVLLNANIDMSIIDQVYDETDFYHAKNPQHSWIEGKTKNPHLSILTGIDTRAYKNTYIDHPAQFERDVLSILNSVDPELTLFNTTYYIKNIRVFQNETPGEDPHDCVVGILDIPQNSSIQKLRYAPSANFTYTTHYPDYTPHITLAYVRHNKGAKLQRALSNTKPIQVTLTACHASFELGSYPLAPMQLSTTIHRLLYLHRYWGVCIGLLLYLLFGFNDYSQ